MQWVGFAEMIDSAIGRPLTFLYFFGFTLATITIDGTLLMFHLSYYSIAQYIRLLQGQLTDYHNDKTLFLSWKGKKRVLHKLHKASVALSAVFSVPVLLTIAIKLFTL